MSLSVKIHVSIAGPSFAVDSACSSGLLALDHALRAIRTGQCDSAIVGGAHLCLHASTTIQYTKFGMLSPYGACKTFDASRNYEFSCFRALASAVQLNVRQFCSCSDFSKLIRNRVICISAYIFQLRLVNNCCIYI